MMLELLVIIVSFISAIVSLIAIIINTYRLNEFNWPAVASFIFFTLLFWALIKPARKKTPEQIKNLWKYKDYQAVYEYLDTYKRNLSYEKEDRESLAILLFFDWIIEDDRNPNALILTRVTTSSKDTQIFKPKNKKIL